MDEKLQRDLYLSHSLLSFLRAGYEGEFAYFNILGQLKHPAYDNDGVNHATRSLGRIDRWIKDVYEGIPFVSHSWESVETFDAGAAFDILTKLKNNISHCRETIYPILIKTDEALYEDEAQLLLAAYGRFAYSRELYLRGIVEFGTVFQIQSLIDGAALMHEAALADIEFVNQVFSALQTQPEDQDGQTALIETLLAQAQELPIVFATQLHEASILEALYGPPLTYQSVGIGNDEAARWHASFIDAVGAGYWRAYEIGPEEAVAWAQAGVSDPALARRWKFANFSPADVVVWAEQNIDPQLAEIWRDANFSPEQALDYLSQGIVTPDEIGKKP